MMKSDLPPNFWSSSRLPETWNRNADPLVTTFPLVNSDVWVLVSFLAGSAACRFLLQPSGRKIRAKIEPLIFLYHCFMCGLCFAAFVIGCILISFDGHVLGNNMRTFSTYGFWGKVRMYSVYIAFLVKLCHVVECIWCHSLFSQIVSLMEGLICLMSMKFDATAHIWIGGMLHLPFLLFTNYLNAIEISRTEDAGVMFQIRRKLVYLMLAAGSTIGILIGVYTLISPFTRTAFPRHWALFALIYPVLAYTAYPRLFVAPYMPRQTRH